MSAIFVDIAVFMFVEFRFIVNGDFDIGQNQSLVTNFTFDDLKNRKLKVGDFKRVFRAFNDGPLILKSGLFVSSSELELLLTLIDQSNN